jgi:hypothetical protein
MAQISKFVGRVPTAIAFNCIGILLLLLMASARQVGKRKRKRKRKRKC